MIDRRSGEAQAVEEVGEKGEDSQHSEDENRATHLDRETEKD